MTRYVFLGGDQDLTVAADASNADALKMAPSTAYPLYDAPGGTLQDDFLLWDGSDYTIPATGVTSDAAGLLVPGPGVMGPDGLSILYNAAGAAVVGRTDPAGAGSVADWDTLVDKPTFVGAGSTAALARDAIDAGVDTLMTTLEAQTGTDTNPRQMTAAVLKAGVLAWAKSNLYMQPVWSGSGAHPTRPAGLTGYFVIWRQPTAPLTTAGYALPGDEWEVTE